MFAGIYRDKVFISGSLLIAILGFFISAPPVQAALVNINTAGSEELDTLDGIGPAYAQRIIDYRTASGAFQKIEDIKNVSGIGEVTFAKIKDSITVGSVPEPTANEGNDSSLEDVSETTAPSASSASSFSTHYNSNELSKPFIKPGLEIGAGRARLGVVGGPMEFKAETDLTYTKTTSFRWNFGDGTTGEGLVVNHTYNFPGEYVVVLNVLSNEGTGVSRVDVKIIEPALSVSFASPERVEIFNTSGNEVNLYGRAIVSGNIIFAFPRDTIIKSKQRISFGSDVTRLKPLNQNNIALVLVGESGVNEIELEKIRQAFSDKIVLLKQQLIKMQGELRTIAVSDQSKTEEKKLEPPAESLNVDAQSQTAAVINAVPGIGESPRGFWNGIKRFFLRK